MRLHQRPRTRLVPLPEYAAEFIETTPFAQGGLLDALLKAVRELTQRQRTAIERARRNPRLRVGLHIAVCEGRPVLPPSQVPDLVDARTGQFHAPLRAAP